MNDSEKDYYLGEIHSDDVQEILGAPPTWPIRWGSALMLLVVAGMALLASLVRYPDLARAPVVISADIPPGPVISPGEGYVARLFVANGQRIKTDQLLAALQSAVKLDDALLLDSLLAGWLRLPAPALRALSPPPSLQLGELQAEYAAVLSAINAYAFEKNTRKSLTKANVGAFNEQIARLEAAIQYDKTAADRLAAEIARSAIFLEKQEIAFQQGLISADMLNAERRRHLQLERDLEVLNEGLTRKQNEIAALGRNASDLNLNEQERGSGSEATLLAALSRLRAALDAWKKTHLLTAPIAGKAVFNASFSGARQYVRLGEQIMTIVPDSAKTLVGRASLPAAGSGKVKPGQKVLIKLDSYPYQEFGVLEGRVVDRSGVPKDGAYNLTIELTKGLFTSAQRMIPFEQQLQGEAEIITDDKSFLRRVVEQIALRR
ncbi:MAG: HlyD family secretion protein [Saprospiraceae bacterium]